MDSSEPGSAIGESRDNLTPPWLLMFVTSGAALAFEVLLIRWFSIVQWHHLAFLVVSLALLGHGLSGSLMSLWLRPLLRRYVGVVAIACAGFVTSGLFSLWASQHLGFNSLEILWDPLQWLRLCVIYLCLLVPFSCAAVVLALTLRRFPERINALYAADLWGAGVGALAITWALYRLSAEQAAQYITLSTLMALLYQLTRWRSASGARFATPMATGLLLITLLLALTPAGKTLLALQPAPYKPLTKILLLPETRIQTELSSPLGWLNLVASPRVPLRITPGLSLYNTYPIAPQKALFIDGEGPYAVIPPTEPELLQYLTQTPDALALELLTLSSQHPPRRQTPKLLLLHLHGNTDLLQLQHWAQQSTEGNPATKTKPHIDIVESDRTLLQLMRPYLNGASGTSSQQVFYATPEGFLRQNPSTYDLIKLPSFGLQQQALRPHYLLTVEALQLLWQRLSPSGLLVVNLALQLPPRASLKLVNTLREALEQLGIQQTGDHLLLLRSWNQLTLLARPSPFTAQQLQHSRQFAQQRGFDLVHLPGLEVKDTNRYNQLPASVFYHAVNKLLNPARDSYVENYPFDITVSHQDRPYFFRFSRWQSLPDLYAARASGGLTLIGLGYPVLLVGLMIAVVLAVLLILLPLWRTASAKTVVTPRLRGKTIGYFGALGLAFLMVEIVLIEWLVQFLSAPTLSAAVVMASLLVFAGLGSLASEILPQRLPRLARSLPLLIAMLGVLYCLSLPPLFAALAHWSLLVRCLICVALLAPLATLMGMPFPLGLQRLSSLAPDEIPWAWAINGCCSVISAVLTTLLAVHLGFTKVLLIAFSLYASVYWIRLKAI